MLILTTKEVTIMKERKHDARILVISDDIFKKRVQIKALRERRTVSDVIRVLLLKWLNEK